MGRQYFRLLRRGKGTYPDEFFMAEICERFGWTEETYKNQRVRFLEVIKEKIRKEERAKHKAQKKQEKQIKKNRR